MPGAQVSCSLIIMLMLLMVSGCNLWRNWHDIGCGWSSVSSIIDHWGDYGPSLVASGGLHGDPGAAGGGHYHDMCALHPEPNPLSHGPFV